MLSFTSLGALDPMVGFLPNLREGSDYRVTSSGVAVALTQTTLSLFLQIQKSINTVANLVGMPGSITVDGKIGSATGTALKFVMSKLTIDLQRNLSPEARAGIPSAIAKDARNVAGTLSEAIALLGSGQAAPLVATAIPDRTASTVRMQLFPSPTSTLPTTALQPPSPSPVLPLVQPGVGPTSDDIRFVTTAPAPPSRISTPVVVAAAVAGVLAVGIGAVLIARR